MSFTLANLPYDYNALEPYIDARTMEIHHSKHHAAYTNNLNAVIKDTPMDKLSIEALLKDVSKYPTAVRNNGGGFYNHNLFWAVMGPNAGGLPQGDLLTGITQTFGSFDNFKKEFSNAAATRFGSGWAWLIVDKDHKLKVISTPNQDNPLMDIAEVKGFPILALDVWEHAYYLKYQNRRPEYIENFWNVVNWNEVTRRYTSV
jgi:Fe-Mn family superoxide dismutase